VLMGWRFLRRPRWCTRSRSAPEFSGRRRSTLAPPTICGSNLTQPIIPGDPPQCFHSTLRTFAPTRCLVNGMGFGNHMEVGIGAAYQDRKVESLRGLSNGATEPPTEIMRISGSSVPSLGPSGSGGRRRLSAYASGGICGVHLPLQRSGEFVDTRISSIIYRSLYRNGKRPSGRSSRRTRIRSKATSTRSTSRAGISGWSASRGRPTTPSFLGNRIDLGGGTALRSDPVLGIGRALTPSV
jgi:hypothetical protein